MYAMKQEEKAEQILTYVNIQVGPQAIYQRNFYFVTDLLGAGLYH